MNTVLPQETRYVKTYVYGLDLISVYTGDLEHGTTAQDYYFSDGLGSTVTLARDSVSGETGAWTYDAFGEVRSKSGVLSTDLLFTGEQRDSESDLYYLRARYFDPSIGRFLTKDPFAGFVASPLSQNRYPYSVNDPVNLVDPWGLCGFPPRSFGDAADCAKDAADTTRDAIVDAAQSGAEGVKDAADTTRDAIVDAAQSCTQAISTAIEITQNVLEYLGTCDWRKIAGGAVAFAGAAVAVGTGGYVIWVGYGAAAGATSLMGTVEGLEIMTQGGIIVGAGGGGLGVLGAFAFWQADCGEEDEGMTLIAPKGPPTMPKE